jgi:quinol monooxygenase YgiN
LTAHGAKLGAEDVEVALKLIREDGSVTDVYLSGQLVCRNTDDVAIVVQHLDRHITLTRAEPGCVSFSVMPTGNPLVWQVDEHFRDAAAFRIHQDRVADSTWGHATAGIERRYTIRGL